MGSVLSLFGIGQSPAEKKAKKRAEALEAERTAKTKSAKEEEEKLKVATKLALISTGAGGTFSPAKTGRKKLLGN